MLAKEKLMEKVRMGEMGEEVVEEKEVMGGNEAES